MGRRCSLEFGVWLGKLNRNGWLRLMDMNLNETDTVVFVSMAAVVPLH